MCNVTVNSKFYHEILSAALNKKRKPLALKGPNMKLVLIGMLTKSSVLGFQWGALILAALKSTSSRNPCMKVNRINLMLLTLTTDCFDQKFSFSPYNPTERFKITPVADPGLPEGH